jgi:Ubiquitin elongating factor core
MLALSRIKNIATIMPQLPEWIPENPLGGSTIEHASLLGRFFSLSPLAPDVAQTCFASLKSKSSPELDRLCATASIQEDVRRYQDYLFEICKAIIKSGVSGRRGVLDWFSAALEQNRDKKLPITRATSVASHGFMCNLVAVLNLFAAPFVEQNLVQSLVRD